jgi:deoxyribonuclease-4
MTLGETKMGLKLWARNHKHIDEAAELIRSGVFDYLEIMPEAGYDTGVYPGDIKYVVHANKFINPADVSEAIHNRSMMRLSIRWADALGSDTIIVHPGYGSLEDSCRFVNSEEWEHDERIIVENMPYVIDGQINVPGNSPTDIKMYGRPICLDIGHMMSSSVSHRVGHKSFLESYLALKPRMAHIMDGYSDYEDDQHLAIGEGDYDLKYIVSKLIEAKIRYATLETPWNTPKDTAIQLDRLKSLLYN